MDLVEPSAQQSAKPPFLVPTPFAPDWAVSPGQILLAELNARQMSQAELASRTGLSTKHINQVVKALVPLSPDTAARLEMALGVPSHLWNALEAAHQDRAMRQRTRSRQADYLPWLQRFPLSELKDRGVLTSTERVGQVEQLLKFFQVASPDAYDKVWAEPLALGFKRAQHLKVDPYATALWVRLGEIAGEKVDTDPFDEKGLRQLLPRLRKLTRRSDQSAFTELQKALRKVGVAIVFVNEVTGSRAQGATRWLSPDKALIVVTSRYKWADSFWFTVMHELAHILLHPRRLTFIDLRGADDADGREGEANDFAANTLLPGISDDVIGALRTKAAVEKLADSTEVDPGIVAGRYGRLTDDWIRFAKFRHQIDLGS